MLQAGFMSLTILMAFLLVQVLVNATAAENRKRLTIRIDALLIFWIAYVAIISYTGLLNSTALPPRIPLLLVLPTFIFMTWFFTRASYKPLIATTSAKAFTYMQSYRIAVELLLWLAFKEGILPRAATFEGYNYDILIGILALPVGYFGYRKRSSPTGVVLAWNILGLITLAIVASILLSHVYFPDVWKDGQRVSMKDFASFPFTLLAGFLMPLAIFMHIFCIIKLRNKQMK